MPADYERQAPTIFVEVLPAEEHESARQLITNFHLLAQSLASFRYALALFDQTKLWIQQARIKRGPMPDGNSREEIDRYFAAGEIEAKETELPIAWCRIAATAGATEIWDFFVCLTKIKDFYSRCPTLKALKIGEQIHKIISAYVTQFEDRKAIRDAPLHKADLWSSPAEVDKNIHKGELNEFGFKAEKGTSMAVIGGIHGRKVLNTINGKIVSYEISRETYEQLRGYQQELLSAFVPVENATKQMLLDRIKAPQPPSGNGK